MSVCVCVPVFLSLSEPIFKPTLLSEDILHAGQRKVKVEVLRFRLEQGFITLHGVMVSTDGGPLY